MKRKLDQPEADRRVNIKVVVKEQAFWMFSNVNSISHAVDILPLNEETFQSDCCFW